MTFLLDDLLIFNPVELTKLLEPFRVRRGLTQWQECGERLLRVCMYRHIGFYDLADLCLIDLYVDDLSLARVTRNISRYPVVETHADADEYIALVRIKVRAIVSVHAEEAHVIGMVGRETAQPQQRTRYGYAGLFGERLQFFGCPGKQYALPGQDIRTFRLVDQFRCSLHLRHLQRRLRAIRADARTFLVGERLDQFVLSILCDIDKHGSGASAVSDVKRPRYRGGDVLSFGYLNVPLGDRYCGVDHVGFLERIRTQQVRKLLADVADDRRGIDQRVGKACDEVGCSGTGGGKHHTGFSRCAGKSLRRMDSALLMPDQDMIESVGVVVQRIVYRHDGAAGVTKDGLHAFRHQAAKQRFSA